MYFSYCAGVLVYLGTLGVITALFMFFLGPRYGKTNPFVYVLITAIVGSLTIMSAKAFGLTFLQAFPSGCTNCSCDNNLSATSSVTSQVNVHLHLACTTWDSCCKSTLEICGVKFDWGIFLDPFLWIALVLTLATVLLQIYYLNRALDLFNTGVVTTIFYVLFTISMFPFLH